MENENSEQAITPKTLSKTTVITLSVAKAGISSIPVVGGAIASLLGDAVQAHTDRAVARSFEMLRDRLEELSGRIDPNGVNKDEFAELFKSCYLVIVRTHQEKKLRAAANLIANVLLKTGDPSKLPYTELDHFVRAVDNLSIGAIDLVGLAYDLARSQTSDLEKRTQSVDLQFVQIRNRMKGTDEHLLMALLAELNAAHLIHAPAQQPTIQAPGSGNYRLQLTPLGIRFVLHLSC